MPSSPPRPRLTIQDRAARALAGIHSVLFRLIVSFIALILLVALTVSGVAYLYFQGKYNAELENFHELYLKNIEKELQRRLADSARASYMEIANLLGEGGGPLFGPEDSIGERSGKIYSSFVYLGNLAARNYDGIEAIHLYYVKSGLLVSSTGFSAEGGYEQMGKGRDWYERLAAGQLKGAWELYERPAYYGVPAMSLYRSMRSYPILSTPEESSVIVAIDFRASLVREIMDRLMPGDSGSTALMREGSDELLAARDAGAWDPRTLSAFRSLLSEGRGGVASRTIETASGPALLTALPFAGSGWHLVNVAYYSRLYQKGSDIRATLASICLAAIVLGLLVSGFLTSRIYNPLDRLLERFRSILPPPRSSGSQDEYEVLGSALDGISTRMGELEAAIEAHRPAIKNELVLRLLEGEPVEREELQETLALLGLPELPPRLRAALLSIPAGAGSAAEEGPEAASVLKYRLAGELEAAFPNAVLTGILPGRRIGMLLAEGGGEGSEGGLLEACAAFARERGGRGMVIAAGPAADAPAGLAPSFAIARELAEYRFLFPELAVLAERPGFPGRSDRGAIPDPGFLPALAACLGNRDLPAFRAQLRRFGQAARSGGCGVRACKADLERVNQRVAAAAKELGLDADPALESKLRELLAESETLDAYLEELLSVAEDLCAGDRSPQQQRSALLVGRVKDYVKNNLAEDLSLDRISAAMAISPGYMCKIFKEASGSSFLSYVKEARLAEAARLLEEGREPVQEIGRRVGFGAPAYFIRVFKGRYGQTPLDYRRSRRGSRNSA